MTEPGLPLSITSPKDREILRRLFRMKRVELEMMRDRGSDISRVFVLNNFVVAAPQKGRPPEAKPQFSGIIDFHSFLDVQFTFEHFLNFRQTHNIFASRILFTSLYTSKVDGSQTIVMYLENEPGKQVVKEGLQLLLHMIYGNQLKGIKIILIAENGLHSGAVAIVSDQTAGYNIQIFFDQFFATNPIKHAYAPISIKLIRKIPGELNPDGTTGPNSIDKWSKEEGIETITKLPLIYTDDSVSKYFGAESGDVFAPNVLSKAIDVEGYYRLVVRTPLKKK